MKKLSVMVMAGVMALGMVGAVAQPQKHRQKVQHLLQRAQQQKQQKAR